MFVCLRLQTWRAEKVRLTFSEKKVSLTFSEVALVPRADFLEKAAQPFLDSRIVDREKARRKKTSSFRLARPKTGNSPVFAVFCYFFDLSLPIF
jgi:hypothetical protein